MALAGSPYEQGVAHGRAACDDVRHNLAVYRRRFHSELGLAPADLAQRARPYHEWLPRHHPDYWAGINGIAAGAGQSVDDIVILNVRFELIYSQLTRQAMEEGCTSFCALPDSTGGPTLLGQNWDWIPDVRGAIVLTRHPGLEVLGFTEAGIFGPKIGVNSRGIGLAVNGLLSTADSWSTLGWPFHVRCHDALLASNLAEATAAVEREPRPCSANFMLASAGEAAGAAVETAPAGLALVQPESGVVAHANHFADQAAAGVTEAPSDRRPFSVHRAARLDELLRRAPVTVSSLMAHLRDHAGLPNAVCRHPEPDRPGHRYQTVTSVIADLSGRRLWATDGPPCSAEYQAFALGDSTRS